MEIKTMTNKRLKCFFFFLIYYQLNDEIAYLPKNSASLKITKPINVTSIVDSGLNAVTKTGSFFWITNI